MDKTSDDESIEFDSSPDIEDVAHRKTGSFAFKIILPLILFVGAACGGYYLYDRFGGDTQTASSEILTPQIETLDSTVKALTAKTNRLEAELESVRKSMLKAATEQPVPETDLAAILARLEQLETEKTMLSLDAKMDDEPVAISTRLSSEYQNRLAALEAQMASLETRKNPEEPAEMIVGPDIPALSEKVTTLSERLKQLDQRMTDLPDHSKSITQNTKRIARTESELKSLQDAPQTIFLPPFPRDEVITALSGLAKSEQGWVARQLGKHVSIRDETAVKSVDDIEKLIQNGDIRGALNQLEALPVAAQEAANDWAMLAQQGLKAQ